MYDLSGLFFLEICGSHRTPTPQTWWPHRARWSDVDWSRRQDAMTSEYDVVMWIKLHDRINTDIEPPYIWPGPCRHTCSSFWTDSCDWWRITSVAPPPEVLLFLFYEAPPSQLEWDVCSHLLMLQGLWRCSNRWSIAAGGQTDQQGQLSWGKTTFSGGSGCPWKTPCCSWF